MHETIKLPFTKATVSYAEFPAQNAIVGDCWYNSRDGFHYIFSGEDWIALGPNKTVLNRIDKDHFCKPSDNDNENNWQRAYSEYIWLRNFTNDEEAVEKHKQDIIQSCITSNADVFPLTDIALPTTKVVDAYDCAMKLLG